MFFHRAGEYDNVIKIDEVDVLVDSGDYNVKCPLELCILVLVPKRNMKVPERSKVRSESRHTTVFSATGIFQ